MMICRIVEPIADLVSAWLSIEAPDGVRGELRYGGEGWLSREERPSLARRIKMPHLRSDDLGRQTARSTTRPLVPLAVHDHRGEQLAPAIACHPVVGGLRERAHRQSLG